MDILHLRVRPRFYKSKASQRKETISGSSFQVVLVVLPAATGASATIASAELGRSEAEDDKDQMSSSRIKCKSASSSVSLGRLGGTSSLQGEMTRPRGRMGTTWRSLVGVGVGGMSLYEGVYDGGMEINCTAFVISCFESDLSAEREDGFGFPTPRFE